MAEATLILQGRSELAVRMALLNYKAELEKVMKKEATLGVETDDTEEQLSITADLLSQLGWRPAVKEPSQPDVIRKAETLDMFTDIPPSATGVGPKAPTEPKIEPETPAPETDPGAADPPTFDPPKPWTPDADDDEESETA